MKKKIIIILALITAASVILVAIFLNSPLFTMLKIRIDTGKHGIGGLEPHLTEKAQKNLDVITEFIDSDMLSYILKTDNDTDIKDIIATELKHVKWSFGGIDSSKADTALILNFYYSDDLNGTLNIYMIRQNDLWMVDDVGLPEENDNLISFVVHAIRIFIESSDNT